MKTKTRTKAEQSYRMLKESLLSGAFSPGDRVTESLIVKKTGLGRVPVREAMLRLEAEGLLKSKGPYGGKYVEYLEDQNPRDLLHRYELREVIEGQAARLAAKSLTGWQIDQLEGFARRVVDADHVRQRPEKRQASRDFHQYLLTNCGNPLLLEAWESFHLMPVVVRSSDLESKILAKLDETHHLEELLKTVEAIKAHDPDAAERWMRQFVREITEAIRQTL